MLLYLNESTERSISSFEFTNTRAFRLNDRPFVQGAYIFRLKKGPFTSLKMVLGLLINYVMICPLLILLRVQK